MTRDQSTLKLALDFIRQGVLSIDLEGRIWRHKNDGRPVVPPRRAENPGQKGYLRLTLGIPGTGRTRCVQAHRVIWTWLNGPIPDGMEINHKDLVKTNNRPDNLEVVTPSGNIRHSYANGRPLPWHKATIWRGKPKVTTEQVAEMRRLRSEGRYFREISQATGFSLTHVQRLINQ